MKATTTNYHAGLASTVHSTLLLPTRGSTSNIYSTVLTFHRLLKLALEAQPCRATQRRIVSSPEGYPPTFFTLRIIQSHTIASLHHHGKLLPKFVDRPREDIWRPRLTERSSLAKHRSTGVLYAAKRWCSSTSKPATSPDLDAFHLILDSESSFNIYDGIARSR